MREKFNSFAEIEVGKVIKHCEHAIELISEHKRHAKQQNMEQILEHRNSHLHWWHRKPYTEEEILEEAEKKLSAEREAARIEAEKAAKEVLSIPVHPGLSVEDVEKIVSVLSEAGDELF